MAKSLTLDWNELLPAESENSTKVHEIEIIKTPNGNDLVSNLDNSKISEKIKRLRSTLNSGITKNLPDNGKKLRHNLEELENEFHRRKKLANPKKDTDMSCQSNPVDSSGSHHGFSPCTTKKPPSFGTLFNRRLDEKVICYQPSIIQFRFSTIFCSNEYLLLCKSITRNKSQTERKNGGQLNQIKTKNNYGSLPFKSQSHCDDKFSNRNVHELSCAGKSVDCGLFMRMTFFAMSIFRSRKESSEDSCAFHQRSEKVKDVVLLDDEEAEADVQLSEDALTDCKSLKLYYPSRDDPEAIELTSSDIQCLNPGTYLTSPIMNFYIRYLQRLISPTGRNGDYHFFNTYFYKKLLDDVSFKGDKDEQFLKLRRWWKGINIFQKAYIFLPIHGDMHWSLVIICMPDKKDALGPIILHLDSLGIHSSDKIFDVVKCFLAEEWSYLKENEPPLNLPFYDKIWNNLPSEIRKQCLTVPQQKNDYDCGLFVLYFMEKFIEEAPKRFRKEYISTFGRTTGRNWFKPDEASGLRKKIRHLLAEQRDNAESDNNEVLESPNHSRGSSQSEPHELIDIC